MAATTKSPAVLQLLAHDLRWQLVTALARSDHHVKELVHFVGQPPNLVSYHLKRLRDGAVVRERRSSADGRDVYYSLDLDWLQQLYRGAGEAIHPGLGSTDTHQSDDKERRSIRQPVRVLFLCTHNSARSQMAEGIVRHLGSADVEAYSAGSEPATVHPEAVRTLKSLDIDVRHHRAKHLDEYRDQRFDYIITVCDRVRETCPVFPGDPERIHWSVADPTAVADEGARRKAFEQTVRELSTRIRHLLTLIEREKGR